MNDAEFMSPGRRKLFRERVKKLASELPCAVLAERQGTTVDFMREFLFRERIRAVRLYDWLP